MSRSELFVKAVAAFMETHRGTRVTEALNRVYGDQSSELDPVLEALQRRSVRKQGPKW